MQKVKGRQLRRVVFITGMLFFMVSAYLPLSGIATGQGTVKTAKELYELSERCGKNVGSGFKEEFGKEGAYSDKGEHGIRSYNSHYNAKLNKCFILMTDENYGKNGNLLKMLWDINENKEYGQHISVKDKDSSMFPTRIGACYVLEKYCNSQKEWDSLVKPYMEE